MVSCVSSPDAKRQKADADQKKRQEDEEDHLIALAQEEAEADEDVGGSVPVADDMMDGDAEEIEGDEMVEDVPLGEAGKNWMRPAPSAIDPSADAIVFQQLECDYTSGAPNRVHYLGGGSEGHGLEEAPIVRMFGVNRAGNSVCVFVHGFEPYFYVEAPTPTFSPDDCTNLQEVLNAALGSRDRSKNAKSVLKVEVVHKQTILYYQPKKSRPFLKISVALPNLVASSKTIIEHGLSLPWLGCTLTGPTYESNIPYALRYMIDSSISGGCWVELPASTYTLVTTEGARTSHCQIEAHVGFESVIAHAPEGEWSELAPFRILSVDIECQGRKGHFPEAEHDPVIQIASLVTNFGETSPVVKNIMTLKSCSPIPGAEVMSFESEKDMLARWRDLLVETDPDIIIGYNIVNFDLPYLLNRATTLGLPAFHAWGRMRGRKVRMRDARFSSKAYGTHEYKEISIDGRVQFDLLQAIQRDHKLSSYSLNSVSYHFLNEQKEDVHHSEISKLQEGNAESRRRLAVYCLKDAYLPQRLVEKLMYMYNYIEMARVTGVPMSYLLTRGQSIKVFSQILRKARERDLIVPNIRRGGPDNDGVAYEGATVLEPKAGYYDKPVATLDFASLYPSIMMAHNLCYTTLVPKHMANDFSQGLEDDKQAIKTPNGDVFVKSHVQQGLLPEILTELLSARKRAKKDMASTDDPFKKAVYNGRQLALKVSANSVYGFTGATVGALPCLEISSSTTAFGRQMIDHTRDMVMQKYTRANGYPADADVIYGDTDSVMVLFGVPDTETAMRMGEEAADYVSDTFIKPIKLEFEKVYNPYLLISKKRYAGLLWTNPEKFDKIDTKGIETVRRDNCMLVRNVITTCLDKILIDRDPNGAVEYVKGMIADLLQNKLDLSLLVISKGLTQDPDKYETKAAHVELAKKMRKRDPATAPTVGDRVPYVIVTSTKKAKAYEKAEDPLYALRNKIGIDTKHYLDHHLALPLERLFMPILKNPKSELLSGDHTRTVTIATPSATAGGIMKFAKKRLSCLGCRAQLGPGETTVCKHCKPREAEIFGKTLANTNSLEAQFSALWTQCQRCQGSLHLDVLCASRDCPIFYRRMKVSSELTDAQANMQRFIEADVDDW